MTTKKSILCITLLVALLVPAVAFAGFFDSVKKAAGVEKDEEVKIESKDLCPQLAAYAGTKYDPYAEEGVTYTKINVQQVDDFTLKSLKLTKTMDFASKLISETSAEMAGAELEKEAMLKRLADVQQVLTALVGNSQEVVGSGQSLVTSLPSVLAGPKAMKVKSVTKSVKESITSLTELPDKAKKLGEDVKNMVAKLSTESLVDAAKEVADDKIEQGKEAVAEAQQAAGEAVEQAKDTAGEAVEQAKDAAADATEKAGEAAAAAGDAAAKAGEQVEEAAEKAGEAMDK